MYPVEPYAILFNRMSLKILNSKNGTQETIVSAFHFSANKKKEETKFFAHNPVHVHVDRLTTVNVTVTFSR